MFIGLEDGTPLRGDYVLSSTVRYDLVPIPSTLEVVLRTDSVVAGRLKFGSVLRAGTGSERYQVVKARKTQSATPQHDNNPVEAVEFTCVHEAFAPLAWPLQRAVVKVAKSMGEVYRSCGAKCRVAADIPVHRFSCFIGDYPTPHIARVLQEEGSTVALGPDGRVSFKRYRELFDAKPSAYIEAGATQVVESPFLEQHETPNAYSVDASGAAIFGQRDKSRAAVFKPRTNTRVLQNMGRCLMVRRTAAGAFAGELRAGQIIDVSGAGYVIVTAAHHMENGSSGMASQTSKLWLAQIG
jgi:hypothetical protein